MCMHIYITFAVFDVVLKWKNTKNEDIMMSKLKCVFEEDNSDASTKVWLQTGILNKNSLAIRKSARPIRSSSINGYKQPKTLI